MSNIDTAINASYKRAFARRGVAVQVTFKRVTGFAPNPVTTVTANVMAVVRDYQPDTTSPAQTGYAATKMGAITEGDRTIVVMGTDLAAAAFPLPLKKNDKVTIVATGEELNVVSVDGTKRIAGGAIELKAAGVG